MVGKVPDAEPQRPGQDSLTDFELHGLDFFRSGLPFLGGLAHDVAPHPGVANECADVDAAAASDGVQILRYGLPSEIHAGPLGLQRDAFHFVEHIQVPVAVSGTDRRNYRAALADNNRRVTVEGRRIDYGVPHALGIEVSVVINETGRDDSSVGVDDAGGGLAEPAHPNNLTVAHRNVSAKLRPPGTVYHPSILDK